MANKAAFLDTVNDAQNETANEINDSVATAIARREWRQKEGADAFIIEKGVPLPPVTRHVGGRKGESKYPTTQLDLGESFVIAGVKRGTVNTMVANVKKQYPDRKFQVRPELGGYRIFRTV